MAFTWITVCLGHCTSRCIHDSSIPLLSLCNSHLQQLIAASTPTPQHAPSDIYHIVGRIPCSLSRCTLHSSCVLLSLIESSRPHLPFIIASLLLLVCRGTGVFLISHYYSFHVLLGPDAVAYLGLCHSTRAVMPCFYGPIRRQIV